MKKLKTFEPLGLNIKLHRHWLFIKKIPGNQHHKLFYLLCNVMLFVFHTYVINFCWGRLQRSEINLEFFVYIYIYIYTVCTKFLTRCLYFHCKTYKSKIVYRKLVLLTLYSKMYIFLFLLVAISNETTW